MGEGITLRILVTLLLFEFELVNYQQTLDYLAVFKKKIVAFENFSSCFVVNDINYKIGVVGDYLIKQLMMVLIA